MAVEIRAAREDEIPATIDLMCLVFGEGFRPRTTAHQTQDSSFHVEQARVVAVDGKIVSYVRVSDRPIRIGRCAVRMGGIGGVCTHPDHRRRGYSRALLRDAVDYMAGAGYDLSMLFARLHGHYGEVGWAPLPAEHKFRVVPPPQPPRVETPYRVRDFDEARDLEAVIRIYDAHNARRTLTVIRTSRYWRDGHSRDVGIMPRWVAELQGQVVAYIQATTSLRGTSLSEAGYLPGHVEGLRALVGRVFEEARAADAEAVQGTLPENHPLVEQVRQVVGRRLGHELRESMMLRVIRLAPLLEKIVPELEDRLAASCLRPHDTSITFHEAGQEATLEIAGGRVVVRRGGGGAVAIDLGTRCFLKMLTGLSTFGQMRELLGQSLRDPVGRPDGTPEGRAAHVDAEHAALLEALFPKGEPVYWDCDHF